MCWCRAPRKIVGMTTTNPEVVTVRGLRKSYGNRVVVADLDLDVRAGEIVGLIGANGAGKTTTVECIQGLRQPDAGVVRVLGCDPMRDTARLRAMLGSQLQDSALPDRLRVGEAVDLFATPRARDAGELLAQFGLEARRKAPFGGLSGGERQRLFLVLALLNRPRLVILDELTQGLDPAARRDVWSAVAQLRNEGTTVLLVTHELDEAEVLCDRVIAMRGGRILDQGAPSELVDRHAPWAHLRFSWEPGEADAVAAELRRLPGVRTAHVLGSVVEVEGDRESIAHVGAYLVGRGCVPRDLHVDLPDLEAALLHLLDASVPAPFDTVDPVLAGASR
jgi:ABC-2 type transport system ATP-binding protein